MIKTSLALRNRQLPASLHFSTPNPKIDFANSPFVVNTKLTDWQGGATPRRAGISSFGIGGTNVHVVLEEAPASRLTTASRSWQLLVFSARSAAALDAATTRFVAHLKANRISISPTRPTRCRSDAARFRTAAWWSAAMCPTPSAPLETLDPKRVITKQTDTKDCPVVFMFPGQGSQSQNMGADLYRTEPVFRAEIDSCAEILKAKLGLDIRQMLFPRRTWPRTPRRSSVKPR